jgi:hypothetical protein
MNRIAIASDVLATSTLRTVGPGSACRASRELPTICPSRLTSTLRPFADQESTSTRAFSFREMSAEMRGTFAFIARLPICKWRRTTMDFGKGALLWLLGVPLPIILLLALFWHH